ncbi:MAG TPA: TetR/AcrR family transcriptional regulator [Solirubrobacterales bacterium]|nr:TetR/AcrR family transcriptional regulator [Solirubrobacterales bacterium]
MTPEPEDLRKWRLPRGRHGLPRELVTRSQRERLLAAVVRATAAKGYGATTVADVLEEAGVGRETFYELFDDKRACALAAHRALSADLEGTVRDAYMEPGRWPERACQAVAETLAWFAADPAAARFMMVEVGAMGTDYRERFQAEFSRFVSLIEDGLEGWSPEVNQAASLAVTALFARLHEEIARGRAAELPSLLPDLTYEMLVPFLGEAPAWAERSRVIARGPAGPNASR